MAITAIATPNSSTYWVKGLEKTIEFSSSLYPTYTVTIDLYREEETLVQNVVTDYVVDADETYAWIISTGLTSGVDYLIKIDDGDAYAWSSKFGLCTEYLSSSYTDSIVTTDTDSIEEQITLTFTDSVVVSDSTSFFLIANTLKSTEVEDKTIQSFNIKFYIQDQGTTTRDPEWVDFTDKLKKQGKYKLSNIGTISHSTESKAVGGVFLSSISDVSMENADGFWDNPSDWSDLKTIYGNTASFSTSKHKREMVLTKNKCRVVVESLLKDGTIREDTVGVFRIRGFSTDSTSGLATLEIVSLAQYLKDAKADKCRNGKSWYENRSIIFLIKELLKLEFGDKDTGELPASFKFPDQLSIPTFDGQRTLSSFGRPPEKVHT
jgi:hypothetical protein